MAQMYLTRFVVEGTSTFPLDMLRYEVCAPDLQIDVVAIAESLAHGPSHRRTITLARYAQRGWHPEVARWRSFGWTVKPDSVEVRP